MNLKLLFILFFLNFHFGFASSGDKNQIDSILNIKENSFENKLHLDKNNILEKFSLKGYGVINYYKNKYDTDPNLKDKFDAERFNLYLEYKFSKRINLKTEFEFEHGGTGSTLELDSQEEFGEFEQEIEKGGEVKIEQLHINFNITPYFNIRAGRLKVYFGLHQTLDLPTRYFTTHRQEMENEILPLGWYENGIEVYGTFLKKITYKLYCVNGLDASGFSSRGWIKGGYQQRFEMPNTNSFAFAGRLDYKFGKHKDTFFGFATYINDAAANRPKNDMREHAYITMIESHISYNEKNIRFNAIGLFGNLQNSEIISLKNANLSNNLGVKRTPVAKNAIGFSAEFGYNIMPLIKKNTEQSVYPFIRFDKYNTMFKTEGNILSNPRWDRNSYTFGINWFIHPQIVFKIQYSERILGSKQFDANTFTYSGKNQKEKIFSTGLGFNF